MATVNCKDERIMTLIGKNIQCWFIAALMIVVALANVVPAAAQSSPPPATPGIVKGTGVFFEVTNSDWLNVTVESAVPIHLHLSSSPKIILMHISADPGPTSTAITLGGAGSRQRLLEVRRQRHRWRSVHC